MITEAKKHLNAMRDLKWYQKLVMLVVVGFLIFTSYIGNAHHKQESERNKIILAKMSPENVKSITVRLWKCCGDDKPVTLNPYYRDELTKRISRMTPTDEIGVRGSWQYYRGIDVDAGAVGQFRIVLMTRESLDGRVRADFQTVGGPQTTTTLYYDADELWSWLKQLPAIAQQEGSLATTTPECTQPRSVRNVHTSRLKL